MNQLCHAIDQAAYEMPVSSFAPVREIGRAHQQKERIFYMTFTSL